VAAEKKKVERFTARGIAVWPRLEVPDTKFDKDGVYQVRLALEGKAAKSLIKQVDEWMDASLEAAKEANPKKASKMVLSDPPYKPEYVRDEDGDETEEETGRTLFNFKLKAKGTKKDGTEFSRKPVIFDSSLKPMVSSKIGGGSELVVSYTIYFFDMAVPGGKGAIACGVSLQLVGVQVLKYVEYTGAPDAEGLGFTSESGFTQDGETEDEDADDDEDDDDEEEEQEEDEDEDEDEEEQEVSKPVKGKKVAPKAGKKKADF
jgi:hypothetical protein